MAARFDDRAVLQNDYAVCHANGGEAVTNQDRAAALGEFSELLIDLEFRLYIQRGRGLVQNQDLSIPKEGPSQG